MDIEALVRGSRYSITGDDSSIVFGVEEYKCFVSANHSGATQRNLSVIVGINKKYIRLSSVN